MKSKPKPKPKPKAKQTIHTGWRFFVLYRILIDRRKGEYSQGIPLEVLAKNRQDAQKCFAMYLGRVPPLRDVLDYSEMIGVWQWIASMKPRVVRDFRKVHAAQNWKR